MVSNAAQKVKFSFLYFFSTCEQVCRLLRVCSHFQEIFFKRIFFCKVYRSMFVKKTLWKWGSVTKFLKSIITQKMKFSIKDFSSKCDQIRKIFFSLKMSLENANTQKIKKQEMLVNLVCMRTRLTSTSCFLNP